MPKSALSPRLLDADNWKGTDDDVWYMRWRIKLKYLYAYGPRATEWWAKWREYPKTLFAICSKNDIFRFEGEGWERDSTFEGQDIEHRHIIWNKNVQIYTPMGGGLISPFWDIKEAYLSRVQYYTRWSFQIQWPLMIAFHWYWKAADVPEYGKERPDTDGKLVFMYFGAHRDGDKVYWFPSAFAGRVWK